MKKKKRRKKKNGKRDKKKKEAQEEEKRCENTRSVPRNTLATHALTSRIRHPTFGAVATLSKIMVTAHLVHAYPIARYKE